MSIATQWISRDFPHEWAYVLVLQRGWPFGERKEVGFFADEHDRAVSVAQAARRHDKTVCAYIVRVKR